MGKRYEYHDSSAGNRGSHKFWEICESKGGKTYVKWGRIGTSGTGDWYDSSVVADRESEKRSKGYKLVGSSPEKAAAVEQPKRPRATPKVEKGSPLVDYLKSMQDEPLFGVSPQVKAEVKEVKKAKEKPQAPAAQPDSDELENILNSHEG